MQITIKHETINQTDFEDVAFGEVFYYQGDIWIKTPTFAVEADDNADEVNAIELNTGEPNYFTCTTIVILPKNVEFVFEY